MDKKAVLEGLLFISGDEGLTKEKISDNLEVSLEEATELLSDLINDYSDDSRGITINKFGDNYKLVTKREHADYYKKIVDAEISESLSNSALETLSIIAYNGPITRIMIDEIRGVSSAHLVRKLVLKNLVKVVGRSELPGKPMLYGVTDQFLDYFGLKSIDDLPEIEIDENIEESDLYDSRYKE